jgi:molybdopterin-containing oxidoreductase family membrane subunit
MSHAVESELREPLVLGDKSLHQVTEDACKPLERAPNGLWWVAFLVALTCLTVGFGTVCYQIKTGIGTWGLNKTIGWAFDITNFVFWVGIGHAGTLISAVLFLFRQKWRTSVMCAGVFPLIHMGRPWLAFWTMAYPNFRGPLWVNFRSPLLWDVFAISTYFTISAVFWYIGLVPDLASARDRAVGIRKKIYGLMSLGWNGSARVWSRYETAYMLFAGLATPLVVSVHTIVSMDFATSVIPGWHTTIFPPYFVIGAIFSGFAMVMTLLIIMRKVVNFEEYITVNHLENMAKVILVTGSIVGLAYGTEFFIAWYSGNPYEGFTFINRATGPFAWAYWIMVTCNVISPQLMWFKKLRRNLWVLFILSIFVNIGMWFERFVIVVTSLHRDYLPSSWAYYRPTAVEALTLLGSFGLFFTCFLLFCRVLPMLAFGEIKGVMRTGKHKGHGAAHGHSGARELQEAHHG